jgi:hypothetical protein
MWFRWSTLSIFRTHTPNKIWHFLLVFVFVFDVVYEKREETSMGLYNLGRCSIISKLIDQIMYMFNECIVDQSLLLFIQLIHSPKVPFNLQFGYKHSVNRFLECMMAWIWIELIENKTHKNTFFCRKIDWYSYTFRQNYHIEVIKTELNNYLSIN